MGSSDAVGAMLGARSVAVVGASRRGGSFGERLVTELRRSSSGPRLHLVNPRYDEVQGLPCVSSLDDVPDPVDLVLLAVGDDALEDQLQRAARRGDRSAVVFGSAWSAPGAGPSLRDRLATTARDAGMALCGGGCMGFVDVTRGLRAMGYLERPELPAGPVCLVSHSGSVFSAMLRSRRRVGYTLAVSSGQEIVTTTADYVEHALDRPETRVVALVLETLHEPQRLRRSLSRAADLDVPVVLLAVGSTPMAASMVAAHSGALAGGDAAWQALTEAHGLLQVSDLDEMADLLELLAAGRRVRRVGPGSGIATVHDSGAERVLVADLAHRVGVPFATLSPTTEERIRPLLDPGLEPSNPLDVWGTGSDTRALFAGCLSAMADDPAVAVVALAVDLVEEYDGDDSYPRAALDAHAATDKPVVVLCNVTGAVDQHWAGRLRAAGVPVLEGTASGLRALGLLMELAQRPRPAPEPAVDLERRSRWQRRLERGPMDAVTAFELLRDYGLDTVPVRSADSEASATAAAAEVGLPVVLKTDEGLAHKSDVGGVVLGVDTEAAVRHSYADLAGRLGPRVLVCATAAAGIELALGVVRDPLLGPLVVLGAGGVLVELLDDAVVALPPLDEPAAARMLDRLRLRPLLAGARGQEPVAMTRVLAAVCAVSSLAVELGADLDALDVNPLVATGRAVTAVDVLVVPRSTSDEPRDPASG